jgi:DNA-binding SARP family transcriptional activator
MLFHLSKDSIQQVQPLHFQTQTNSGLVLICLLGSFRILNTHQELFKHAGKRIETLLGHLAIHREMLIPREQILTLLWPESEETSAGQSLHSLVYALRKLLKEELNGAAPILQINGHYRLNFEAGLKVDMIQFEHFAREGDHLLLSGHPNLAAHAYQQAAALYQGDLCVVTDPQSVIERERLRARYLTLLMRLADYAYQVGDYSSSLSYVQDLLCYDPCREDAHRLAMRCYVHIGERAQAFRQYQICQRLLYTEFGAELEPATQMLFDQIRCNPGSV